jgi:hypothetical protein
MAGLKSVSCFPAFAGLGIIKNCPPALPLQNVMPST